MEQIKVNMTPCGFTPTIHASQDDNSTRKWGFELYDENGKIDSSSIKEQMIFDSRVGGTEQILPENGSDPTTSPIIADIQYPDSLRSEQTFLYRESPTTFNGQSKITHIKGNTLVWNQLIPNGNFADTSGWNFAQATISASNNECTITCTGQYGQIYRRVELQSGHKYYFKCSAKSSDGLRFVMRPENYTAYFAVLSSSYQTFAYLYTPSASSNPNILFLTDNGSSGKTFAVKNAMIFDLTSIGIDNLTTTAEVEAWLSSHIGNLPYYGYTTGKLLPFKGEELKTTGKNLFKSRQLNGTTDGISVKTNDDGTFDISGTATANTGIRLYDSQTYLNDLMQKGGTFTLFFFNGSYNNSNFNVSFVYNDGSNKFVTPTQDGYRTFNVPQGSTFVNCQLYASNGVTVTSASHFGLMIAKGDTIYSSYEPYTENTINLPTLNYFPTGMKSVGSVFDEKTESKAISRIGRYVTNSTTSFNMISNNRAQIPFPSGVPVAVDAYYDINCVSNIFTPTSLYNTSQRENIVSVNAGYIYVRINGSATQADYQNLFASGLEVHYILDTSTEESITTASLVTEKGESPLYYDDELIADCNETISSEGGIFDAKIKLMDDNTIYSQKIQLHVERKP